MGCLFLPIDFLYEMVYQELMLMIIPDWKVSELTKFIFEMVITVFSALLMLAIFLGIILLLNDEPEARTVGRYMIGIPIAIIIAQIVLGIVVRIISKKKK